MDDLDEADKRLLIQSAIRIANLHEPILTALNLRYVEGLSYADIGKRLHRTDQTIRVWEARARRKLRWAMGERWPNWC